MTPLMFSKPTFVLLFKYFDKAASLKWSLLGAVIGLLGWICGNSTIAPAAFKLASGFGWLLLGLTLLAIMLFFMSYFLKERNAYLAYGDFHNVIVWSHPKLLRAVSSFLGLAVSAAVCWMLTGSVYALKTVLLSTMLSGALLWVWAGLLISYDELTNRIGAANTRA